MFESLNGREIVLVGGSGGLGRASADWLVSEGARVIVTYRANAARAESIPGITTAIQADITLEEHRGRILDAAPNLYGLVVFAGEPARSEDLLEKSLATNFTGPILMAREAAARMKDTGTQGAIILFSTMQATALFAGSTAYATPKAALIHAARILAKEMRGPANVRVNVIAPGTNQAGMAEASIAAGKYDRYLRDGMIPRWGRAGDVAKAVRFFLEPDNYITGQVLTVDGGLTL